MITQIESEITDDSVHYATYTHRMLKNNNNNNNDNNEIRRNEFNKQQ